MHIVKVAFEALGFDPRMMRGGTASLVWNLARQYAREGHRVSVVTPAHGCAAHLTARHGATVVDWTDEHTVPVVLDQRLWPDHPGELQLRLVTRGLRLEREGVDFYLLSDAYLDLLPEQFYPPNEMQGVDLAFLKPLVFQVDAIRFIDQFLAPEPVVVQAYEPLFHYLLPPAYARRDDRMVVSTVAMNPPISGKVYRPQVERLLTHLGVTVDLDRFAEPSGDDPLRDRMARYLRPSHLRHEQGEDYTSYYALVAAYTDLIDFVSAGQRDYYSTFRDAPSERLFASSTVARVVRETAHKQIVGGCALPDWWLARDPRDVNRDAVLGRLGLDPRRPTFYHAARFDQNHKGQLELFRAVDAVLRHDREVNFLVRCAVGTSETGGAAGNPYFQEVADRYPGNVYLDWRMVAEEDLFAPAAVADFCLFPSKFELDGFLITLGEAMACGAVPVATAQETLSHYGHLRPLTDPIATGYAVPRSFRTDDAVLAASLAGTIRHALHVYREKPATHRRLSDNARRLARSFTWQRSALARLHQFALAPSGGAGSDPIELALAYGWFDQLSEDDWRRHRGRIAEAALALGDLTAYRRCAPVQRDVVDRLFDAAYRRGDFDRCAELAPSTGDTRRRLVRERCRIEVREGVPHVVYHLPHADRVELVLPWLTGPDTGSGNRYTYPMRRSGPVFTAPLPDGALAAGLVFLLTLSGGRIAWDAPHPHVEAPGGGGDRQPEQAGTPQGRS
ncbi:glycosyltransferase [Micromonospora sp. RB23]